MKKVNTPKLKLGDELIHKTSLDGPRLKNKIGDFMSIPTFKPQSQFSKT